MTFWNQLGQLDIPELETRIMFKEGCEGFIIIEGIQGYLKMSIIVLDVPGRGGSVEKRLYDVSSDTSVFEASLTTKRMTGATSRELDKSS